MAIWLRMLTVVGLVLGKADYQMPVTRYWMQHLTCHTQRCFPLLQAKHLRLARQLGLLADLCCNSSPLCAVAKAT